MHVIVHGGAGSAPAAPTARQGVLDDAAAAGAATSTPLAAVESAVRVLEHDERFNAGRGGAVQADGTVRVDAGVMTADRAVGAVAALTGVEHPVTVARAVCEETPHVLLAGDGGVAFAEHVGVETDVNLFTAATRERFAAADPPSEPSAQVAWVRDHFGDDTGGADPTVGDGDGTRGTDHDTVGAVAGDGDRFAAATSTGGRWFALAGRVGDVPQAGSGFYCTPAGGASATGAGEDITRATLARRAVDGLEAGEDPQAAAEAALERFAAETESTAGLIVLSADGVGSAYNSEAMQTAVARR
ncbi:isoaspartyl peptidase/L-asparaginase [Salinigranum halophilum]|uniref:isoaspartyl peptidase/L-asparaginase n=1 Tax=Salinigranum halophilum TaxID=2565931 RepID=UPI0010A7B4AA|nr:isoaspartyl peptidase/L-asparaginase [Salinigranum halophilum]